MAKIMFSGKEKGLKNNESIAEASEELGITFGCHDGLCGACLVAVESGMENLTYLTKNEEIFGLEDDQRLACQVKIKSGTVKLRELKD